MYSIFLSGGGDSYIYLVNEEIFNWVVNGGTIPEQIIENSLQSNRSMGLAATREDIIRRLIPNSRSSSPDNDRALGVCSGKDVIIFYSLKEFTAHLRKNNINIIDEYEGYIY